MQTISGTLALLLIQMNGGATSQILPADQCLNVAKNVKYDGGFFGTKINAHCFSLDGEQIDGQKAHVIYKMVKSPGGGWVKQEVEE